MTLSDPVQPDKDWAPSPVDPVRAGVIALSWPAVVLFLGFVTDISWRCAADGACIVGEASSLPMLIALPLYVALPGEIAVFGVIGSIALWFITGWLLAAFGISDSRGWSRWWRRYLWVAGVWTVAAIGLRLLT